eukprot:Nitzschia sp. Nitz4//scaffold16_size188269//7770//8942//NITZ4_001764-RA/size188269-processed-gene-0.35-mRNA-1//-1//CDS//3329538434//686//frame0
MSKRNRDGMMLPSMVVPAVAATSTLLLPNALSWQLQATGHLLANILQAGPVDDEAVVPTAQPPSTSSLSPSSTHKDETSSIPESVLQYERHLRQVHANEKSLTPLRPQDHLRLLHDDEHLIVVDKPSGVLCVPGLNNKPNLMHLVCDYCKIEPTSERIVHRLDMDTSGVVIYSKSLATTKALQAAFRDRHVDKEYHALLCGHVPEDWKTGDIHLPLQRDHRHPPFMRVATPRSEEEAARAVEDLQTHGFKKLVKKKPKPSHTEMRVLQREYLEYATTSSSTSRDDTKIPVTRVALVPHTGRTHQLRVHCAALGYPIVGDPAYGYLGEAAMRGGLDAPSDASLPGASMSLLQLLNQVRPTHENTMCLHAARLALEHPMTGESVEWIAETPF